jgi:hypothetical protein
MSIIMQTLLVIILGTTLILKIGYDVEPSLFTVMFAVVMAILIAEEHIIEAIKEVKQ